MLDLKRGKAAKTKPNKRKAANRKRDWRGIFHRILVLVLALGSAGLIGIGGFLAARLLFYSDYFLVERVRVGDLQRIEKEEVLAFADIRTGISIFDLDLEEIGRKLEENPWIAKAAVHRVFPREVMIRIWERTPQAVVNLGYLYYTDASGEIFKALGPEDNLDFPVITGLDRQSLIESDNDSRRWMLAALELLDQVAARSLFSATEVSEVHIDPEEGLQLLTLVGGVPIRMGFGGFGGKLDRLERIYSDLKPQLPNLEYIDLNVTDRVIVKVERSEIYDES